MSCTNIIDGFKLGCRDISGGVNKVYIASFSGDNRNVYTIDSTIGSATYSAITSVWFKNSGGTPYFEIEQRSEAGSFNQSGVYGETGTRFIEQTLELQFNKKTSKIRNILMLMAKNDLSIIIKDNSPTAKYFLMGKENGAKVTASSLNTGKAFGDSSGGFVTIVAKEPDFAYEMTAAAFNDARILREGTPI